jgi:hypothetical protein
MRQLTITCVLAVAALIGAATAGATAPTTTHASIHRSFPNYLPCKGFWIDGEFDLERTTSTFYDDAGIALRTVSHIHADGTLSNPLTGKSIPDSGDFKVTVDRATGATTSEGKVNVATSPGGGIVYHVAGRLVLSAGDILFEAGPHDDADGTYAALCSYLAGP